MRRQLSNLYSYKGWQVIAMPLLGILAVLVLLDMLWPDFEEAQERIESLERRLSAAETLFLRKSEFQTRVETAEGVLGEGRSKYFESSEVDASRKAFLDAVTTIFASLVVPSLNIVPAVDSTEQGDLIVMKIAVSFDASPSQLARFETLILSQPKAIHVESVSIAPSMGGGSGGGVLRVSCTLKSAHIRSGLFRDQKNSP